MFNWEESSIRLSYRYRLPDLDIDLNITSIKSLGRSQDLSYELRDQVEEVVL